MKIENYAEKVKQIRIKLNLKQEELATKLETSQEQVCRWEKGQKPGLLSAVKIDRLYNEITGQQNMFCA